MNSISSVYGSHRSERQAKVALPIRQNVSRGLVCLATILSDLLAIKIAAVLFRTDQSVPQLLFFSSPNSGGTPVDMFLVLGLLFVAIRYFSGDYTQRRLFWDRARQTTVTLVFISAPGVIIASFYLGQYSLNAEILSWTFLIFAIPIFRHGARRILDWLGVWRIPSALISCTARQDDIYLTINSTLSLGYEVNWVAVEDFENAHQMPGTNVQTLRLGDPADLAEKLAREGCYQAVIATSDMQSAEFSDTILRLVEAGISVSFIPSFRRLPPIGVTSSYFFGKDILLLQVRSNLQSLNSRFVKRSFDIVGALAGLIFLAPVFLILAAVIKTYDGGPVFYAARRIGRNGKEFKCFKMRTMAVDAEDRLQRWRTENPELYAEFLKTFKLIDDPRITRPGDFLRKTSLDELPQLFNVLCGDMSLVGPRPVLEQELITHYGTAAAVYKRVRPGLTGLWQVRGRSDTTYEQRVVLDEWYILNWSFWYDIVILLQTVWVVLLRKGAY
jgi:Undecaprenyl-phosphate galactose phosphotransferase, WbaP/exopolysaccharide biosynthesis polyprenyl glycosylphosphotransferase